MSNPSSLNPQVAAMFQQMSGSAAQATPDTGDGFQGEWPAEGLSDNHITGLIVAPGTIKGQGPNKSDLSCADVTFSYEHVPNDKEPGFDPNKPVLKWNGSRMQLLTDSEFAKLNPDDGFTKAMRINFNRFMGHATKILKRTPEECTNLSEVLSALNAICNNPDRRVTVVVDVQRQKWTSKKTGKDSSKLVEFIKDNIGN